MQKIKHIIKIDDFVSVNIDMPVEMTLDEFYGITARISKLYKRVDIENKVVNDINSDGIINKNDTDRFSPERKYASHAETWSYEMDDFLRNNHSMRAKQQQQILKNRFRFHKSIAAIYKRKTYLEVTKKDKK